MNITDVRVFPVDEDKLKAYVTITLDDCFVVRDLKVIHGASGLFIAMPAKRRKDGTYKDIAHPLNADTRTQMERVILDEYARQVGPGVPAGAGLAAAAAGLRALPPAEGAANPASFKDAYDADLHRADADAP
jgi:stage V sporulation protein G